MGVDLQKVQSRLKEEEAKKAAKGGSSRQYWNPEQGKNRIRFMPPWTSEGANADSFYREVYVHWKIGDGNKTFSCPKRSPGSNGTCAVCEEVERLYNTGDPVDKEMAGDMRARVRYFSNIVDLNDPEYTKKDLAKWEEDNIGGACPFSLGDTKILVFGYGVTIWKELLDVFASVDITDPDGGYDIVLTREGEGRNTEYRVRCELKPSAFVAIGAPLTEALHDLDELMPFPDFDTTSKALLGGGDTESAALPPATKAPALPPATKSAALPAKQQVEEEEEADDDDDEPPVCFKDMETVDAADPECVGGVKDGTSYEPCPFFGECNAAKNPPKTKTRRRAAKTAVAATTAVVSEEVDDLEAEMRKQLN